MSDGSDSHHSSIEHINSSHYDLPVDGEVSVLPYPDPQEPKRVEKNSLPVPPYPERGQSVNDQVAFDFTLNQADDIATFKLDLNDRDPHKQNQGHKTGFLEVFAEPDPTYHSVACVWTFSYRTFEITRIYVYKILTLILALPVAFIMGLFFALATFFHIWIIKAETGNS